jgi:UDP-glucose 4-epimerase
MGVLAAVAGYRCEVHVGGMWRMRVLITGGSGFIGENVARGLRASDPDWRVRIFDVRPPHDGSLDHVKGDIFDRSAVDGVVKGSDLVYHMVGMKDAWRAQQDPLGSLRLNVQSLAVVLESMRAKGVRRIVFPSSVALYSSRGTAPIPESTIPRPPNIYGWHKYMCEQLLQGYQGNYGLDYLAFRLFNVYGPGTENVVSTFLSQAKHGHSIQGFGGKQYRDFVHVDDVVQALVRAATLEGVWNRAVNIGSGMGIMVEDVARIAAGLFPGTTVAFTDKEGFVPNHLIADISLARELLGFSPVSNRDKLVRTMGEMANAL